MKHISPLAWIPAALAMLTTALTPIPAGAGAAQFEVITEVSNARLEIMLRGLNYPFERLEEGQYVYTVDGLRLVVLNDGPVLELYAGFTGKAPWEAVNVWNRQMRFTRAFLDEGGEAALTAELDMSAGVTRAAVEVFFLTFSRATHDFAGLLSAAAAWAGQGAPELSATVPAGGPRCDI